MLALNEVFVAGYVGIIVMFGIAGLLTIALAALDLADTVIEEEFKREGHLNGTVRARRVLARFLVVVSLSIESLVVVFQFVHDAPEMLPYAAAIALAAGGLLVAWGVFDRMMRVAD